VHVGGTQWLLQISLSPATFLCHEHSRCWFQTELPVINNLISGYLWCDRKQKSFLQICQQKSGWQAALSAKAPGWHWRLRLLCQNRSSLFCFHVSKVKSFLLAVTRSACLQSTESNADCQRAIQKLNSGLYQRPLRYLDCGYCQNKKTFLIHGPFNLEYADNIRWKFCSERCSAWHAPENGQRSQAHSQKAARS